MHLSSCCTQTLFFPLCPLGRDAIILFKTNSSIYSILASSRNLPPSLFFLFSCISSLVFFSVQCQHTHFLQLFFLLSSHELVWPCYTSKYYSSFIARLILSCFVISLFLPADSVISEFFSQCPLNTLFFSSHQWPPNCKYNGHFLVLIGISMTLDFSHNSLLKVCPFLDSAPSKSWFDSFPLTPVSSCADFYQAPCSPLTSFSVCSLSGFHHSFQWLQT